MTTDLDEIAQLNARYGHLLDDGRFAEWAECWTEDGSFERYQSDVKAQGRDALVAMVSQSGVRGVGIRGRRLTTDHVVSVEGDVATQECYLLFLDLDRAAAVAMVGVYKDKLRRTAAGWLFSERVFHLDFMA